MLASRGILASAHALVHPSVTAKDRDRHAIFIAHMLGLAFAALGVAPLFLALHGAPKPAESLLFALSLAPAGAAMLVARTGRLELGHLAASLGLVLAALVLCFGLRAGAGASVAWLVAAELEAATSLDRRITRLGLIATGPAVLAVVAATFGAHLSAALPAAATATIAGLAFVVAALSVDRLAGATGKVQAESTLRAARSRAIEAALGCMVVGLDRGGSVKSIVAPTGTLLDAPEAEIIGRGFFDRVHVADRPAFLKLIDDVAQRRSAQAGATDVGTFRLRAWTQAGSGPRFHTVEMRARRLDGGGEEVVVAVLDDISAAAGRDHEIEAARSAVAEAMRAKDLFLTTMSHELRTPLNAIIGFSEILGSRTTRPDDLEKQREYARIINQSGQHLLSVVNAVLDMSRIKVGTYPIATEPFDVTALLDASLQAVAGPAREGGVQLERAYPAQLEELVGDKRALRQALVALLANAIKFTPPHGTITLGARPAANSLIVTVTDTGIGIGQDDLARIGEPFFQAGSGTSRGAEGSGLGLALVRGLVGLHGGSLTIESEVGRGTIVSLRIPLDCRAIARRTADAIIEIVPPRRAAPPSLSRLKDAA